MKLMALLPFMDKQDIKEFAKKIANKEVTGISLAVVYPFLDKEDLDELVQDLIKNGQKKDIYAALPFLSKTALNTLYENVRNGTIEGFKEEVLLPFIGKDKIKERFDELVKKASENPEEAQDDVSVIFESEDE
jgi:5,10-methylenetetrahydrofolate reductase